MRYAIGGRTSHSSPDMWVSECDWCPVLWGGRQQGGARSTGPEVAAQCFATDGPMRSYAQRPPVILVLVVAHLVGEAQIAKANSARIAGQRGVGTATIVTTGFTAAAVGGAAYSGRIGKQIRDAGDVSMVDGTTSSADTPAPSATAVRKQTTRSFGYLERKRWVFGWQLSYRRALQVGDGCWQCHAERRRMRHCAISATRPVGTTTVTRSRRCGEPSR